MTIVRRLREFVNRRAALWNPLIRQNRVNFPDRIGRYDPRNTSTTAGFWATEWPIVPRTGPTRQLRALAGGTDMRRLIRSNLGLALGGLVVVTGLTGCQTNIAGMTLPSGYYLQHRPQYFPPDPDFPLQRELATQQSQYAAAADAANAARLPAPVGAAK